MMATEDQSVDEQAIAWTIRARDPDFADWDALTVWLEADAAHAAAFARMTMLDDMLPDLVPARPAERRPDAAAPPARRWSVARLGSLAAALVAVIGLTFMGLPFLPTTFETGPGERQTIALADGSSIALNGDTRITLRKAYPRAARLDRGEALFTVVHNDADPFIVAVGDATVRDAGTVFNIIRDGARTEVGVSEGEVIFNPDKDRVVLKPGSALRAVDGKRRPETFPVAVNAVGSWTRNQLSYNGAAMDRIAADLSRALGQNVTVSAEVKAMRFTGTVNLQQDAGALFDEAAPVLGVAAKQTGQGWILVGADEAIR